MKNTQDNTATEGCAPAAGSPSDDVLDAAVGRHYIIAWASNRTLASGMGTAKFLHSEAVKIAAKANADFPEISHCVLPDTKIIYGRVVSR